MLEAHAEQLLPERTWAYVAGGAADEHTLRWNDEAWQRIRLAPHVLADVSSIDTRLSLLGHDLAHPVLVAPTAAQRDYTPEGELATRRAAAATGALPVMSTLGSTTVEDLAGAADGPWWFQLYVQADRNFTRGLVERAVGSGASALVLTVDTPLLGARDKDRRTGGHTVDDLQPANLEGAPPSDVHVPDPLPYQRIYNEHLDPAVTWEALDWLVDIAAVPVLAKGVLRSDNARRLVDHGVAGLIVSNHGARNLDTVPATADALPRVVHAVEGQVPVLVDGGIRRGTDVAKALCLGAAAVLVGRPVVWGLTVAGETGARWVLDTLWYELAAAMGLLGATSLDELTPDLLWRD
jgi:4-hydroxymandelate oxidase